MHRFVLGCCAMWLRSRAIAPITRTLQATFALPAPRVRPAVCPHCHVKLALSSPPRVTTRAGSVMAGIGVRTIPPCKFCALLDFIVRGVPVSLHSLVRWAGTRTSPVPTPSTIAMSAIRGFTVRPLVWANRQVCVWPVCWFMVISGRTLCTYYPFFSSMRAAPCEAGYYCPGGSFNKFGGDNTTERRPCMAGTYCETGSPAEENCPIGTFSGGVGATSSSNCSACTPGMYCDSAGAIMPAGMCTAGYYCAGGSSTATPTGTGGNLCPAGTFCDAGSVQPVPCPAGSYNNVTTQEECTICPSGFWCGQRSEDFADKPCPAGYYCPVNTTFAVEFPCPVGTFNSLLGAEREGDCQPCTSGHYCETPGLAEPTGGCDRGYYCTGGAITATPSLGPTGGPCTIGNYCPPNSTAEIPCSAGKACTSTVLAEPDADCTGGYTCTGGATTSTPSLGSGFGAPCPIGYYCPPASSSPTPCGAGTFSPVGGNDHVSDCIACLPGEYCNGTALTAGIPCIETFLLLKRHHRAV